MPPIKLSFAQSLWVNQLYKDSLATALAGKAQETNASLSGACLPISTSGH